MCNWITTNNPVSPLPLRSTPGHLILSSQVIFIVHDCVVDTVSLAARFEPCLDNWFCQSVKLLVFQLQRISFDSVKNRNIFLPYIFIAYTIIELLQTTKFAYQLSPFYKFILIFNILVSHSKPYHWSLLCVKLLSCRVPFSEVIS